MGTFVAIASPIPGAGQRPETLGRGAQNIFLFFLSIVITFLHSLGLHYILDSGLIRTHGGLVAKGSRIVINQPWSIPTRDVTQMVLRR